MLRKIAFVVTSLALFVVPIACFEEGPPSGSGYCNSACSKIYNQCGGELQSLSGTPLTFGQCLTTCESTGNPAAVDACVASLSCSNGTGLADCFNAMTPTATCATSCAKIYDECGLALQGPSGKTLSEAHCVDLCEDDDNKTSKISCVLSKSCADGQGIADCINNGTEPPIDDCPSACSEVYNWCELVLNVGGADLTEDECVSHCNAVTGGTVWGCIDTANCDPVALGACF